MIIKTDCYGCGKLCRDIDLYERDNHKYCYDCLLKKGKNKPQTIPSEKKADESD
jgi:hypothetical protein